MITEKLLEHLYLGYEKIVGSRGIVIDQDT